MKMTISAKKMTISQSFTDHAVNKLNQKLDRFFPDEADARVTLEERKGMIILELTVKHENMIFRAEESAKDKNDALDVVIDKIVRQIRKNKTRIQNRLRDNAFADFATEADEQVEFEVIKRKKFYLRPMTVDEAILQMNMLGHTFFMFKDGKTGEVNVVYKRADGNYAVLQPSES